MANVCIKPGNTSRKWSFFFRLYFFGSFFFYFSLLLNLGLNLVNLGLNVENLGLNVEKVLNVENHRLHRYVLPTDL